MHQKKEKAKLPAKPFILENLKTESKIPKRIKKKRNKNKIQTMKQEIYDRSGPNIENEECLKEYLLYLKEKKKLDLEPYNFDKHELELLNLIENERRKIIDYFCDEILGNFKEMKEFDREVRLKIKEVEELCGFFKKESQRMIKVNKKRNFNIKKYK